MELIEKYLYAVGKKLPLKQRSDILKELRSIIMDNLDDMTGGSEPTEDDVTKVLLEMGAPSEVAKRYRTGPPWLIGPDYYDTYLIIAKIVLAATLGGYLISLIILLIIQQGDFGQRLWSFAKNLLGIVPGLLAAVGAVTLIFALIERTAKKPLEIDFSEGEKWSPENLDPVPTKQERVKPIESILGIVFPVLALIIFNVYRTKLGFYYVPSWGEEWVMVKMFNQVALNTYIPLWSVVWALSVGLSGWLLSTGKHNTGTRVFEMFITALNVGILFFMANGPKLFEFDEPTGDFAALKPIADFFVNNQHIIFIVLAVLTLLGLLTSLGKFIYRKAKGTQN